MSGGRGALPDSTMRLCDAFLCMLVRGGQPGAASVAAVCAEVVAKGVDMVVMSQATAPDTGAADEARHALAVCHAGETLFLVEGDPALALQIGADGVHFPDNDFRSGEVRTVLGPRALVGVTAASSDDITLGLTVGADYVWRGPGLGARDVGAGSPGGGLGKAIYTFVGIDRVRAQQTVASGALRLWFEATALQAKEAGEFAAWVSRLMGREI